MIRSALITGGAGALAGDLAAALRADGWTVHAPPRAELDVTDPASVSRYFANPPAFDLVVNNAGTTADGLLLTLAEADWDRVLAVNLRGTASVVRAALPSMVQRRAGHFLHIGSWAARAGTAGQSAYAAAKAGLIGLSHSIALEYGKRGIQSNVVLPGFLDTPMTRHLADAARDAALRLHALGRFNETTHAARFIAHLASQPHVSGQVFQLDSRISPWT
jgi:3-oxoacyl-[acyl-carrier protein] reductase